MDGKRRPGRFSLKEERELIATAASGSTVSKLAAKFGRPAETIERKAIQLGIRLKGRAVEIGPKARR